MKTNKTPLRRIGNVIVVVFEIIATFIPTWIYAATWWHIPKTLWPICLLVMPGTIVWLVIQVIACVFVVLWRYKLSTSEGGGKD